MKFKVYDSVGVLVRVFNTYKEAIEYKYTRGNYGWYIVS